MEQAASDDPVFHRIASQKRDDESDAAFARRIGLENPQTYNNWKHGKSDPTDRETLVTVAENLDVSLDWLLTGDGEAADHPNRPAIAYQLYKVIRWIRGEEVEWSPPESPETPFGDFDGLREER